MPAKTWNARCFPLEFSYWQIAFALSSIHNLNSASGCWSREKLRINVHGAHKLLRCSVLVESVAMLQSSAWDSVSPTSSCFLLRDRVKFSCGLDGLKFWIANPLPSLALRTWNLWKSNCHCCRELLILLSLLLLPSVSIFPNRKISTMVSAIVHLLKFVLSFEPLSLRPRHFFPDM